MKHKIWFQHIISAVLAFVLSVSAIGNLITGYALPVESLWKIYLWCALFAFASSVLLRFRYGGRSMACLAVLTLLMSWGKETFWQQMQEQAQYLCYVISSHYNYVYDWPVLGNSAAKEASIPLTLWAALVAVSVNLSICRRNHCIIAIIPATLPLVLCLLTTDKVPGTVYLYLLILGLSILLLTDWTRRKQPLHGTKLILHSALPVAVFLALLFALNPRDKYVNNAGRLQKEVVALFQEFRDKAESVTIGNPINAPVSEKLNLSTVGPKSKLSHSIMRVYSPIGGSIYLRGRDYDQYTGTGWVAASERNEEFTSGGLSVGELTIVTYGVRNVLYVPYYTTREVFLVGGALENDENLQRYSYYLSRTGSGNSESPSSRYTKLPEDTLTWARLLVNEVTGENATDEEKIVRIQDYVRNSAIYDLSTPRMDSSYNDFAHWFLEESETGYCVHFATATTVLLRAAGIPARYVEGYMVRCNEGSDVIVTNQDAHAWAEYYDSASDTWRVLEATPADSEAEVTEPTVPIQETESTPEETLEEVADPDTFTKDPEDITTGPQIGNEDDSELLDDSTDYFQVDDQEKEPIEIPGWIKTAFKCLLFAACIPLQYYMRIYWKRTLWNRGRPNERAIVRWRQTRSLAKLLQQSYPESLDNLAQKAKFSQHRIQPEELQKFDDYRLSLIDLVFEKPWYERMIFKWILAVERFT